MTDVTMPGEGSGTARPLVTFALFAFNHERYIREAVEGAFAQTYEPVEIILSDDCSSDRGRRAGGHVGPAIDHYREPSSDQIAVGSL